MTQERAARNPLFVAIFAAIACVLLVACGGEEPAPAKVPTPTTPATPTAAQKSKARTMPVPTTQELVNTRVELPDFYPEDAPVYSGAQANSVAWESGRVAAVFTTSDSPSEVSEKLQAELDSKGWQDIITAGGANGVVVQAGKDERGISALVSETDSGGKPVTMIMVAVDP
jgi:hypothetical protein